MLDDNRVYNELKDLNKNYHDLGVSNARGEEQLKGIHKQFKELNGSVKSHTKKIWWIEKVLWTALGAFGVIQVIVS